MHRIRKLCLTWDGENDEIRPFHLSVDKLDVRYNKKRVKNKCLISLKRGKNEKKIPLITDGGVKAFIAKAQTGIWMMNPSLIIIVCLEVVLFLLLSF